MAYINGKKVIDSVVVSSETMVESVQEQNHGARVGLWIGTQAEYDALPEKDETCLHIISDDTAFEDMVAESTKYLRVLSSDNALAYGATFQIDNSDHREALLTRKTALVRVAGQSVLCSVAKAADYTSVVDGVAVNNLVYISGCAPYSADTATSVGTVQLVIVDIRITFDDLNNPTEGTITNRSRIQNLGGGNVTGANSNVAGVTVWNILLNNAIDYPY